MPASERPMLKPRERRLALVTGLLVGSWAVVSLLIQPLWERARQTTERITLQSERLTTLQEMLRRAPMIERQFEQASRYLASAGEGDQYSAFLHEVEALSRTTQLKLNLKPRPTRREERLIRTEVELDLEGSQQNLLRFLDDLLRMPRLLLIERLRLAVVPTRTDVLRASLVVQLVTPLR